MTGVDAAATFADQHAADDFVGLHGGDVGVDEGQVGVSAVAGGVGLRRLDDLFVLAEQLLVHGAEVLGDVVPVAGVVAGHPVEDLGTARFDRREAAYVGLLVDQSLAAVFAGDVDVEMAARSPSQGPVRLP
jgi:hypothetical protein